MKSFTLRAAVVTALPLVMAACQGPAPDHDDLEVKAEDKKELAFIQQAVTVPVPIRIEGEAFTAASDTTSGNSGDASCTSAVNGDVDIEVTNDRLGVCSIGWTAPGEWLEYDFSVAQGGDFDIRVKTAAAAPNKRIDVKIDGTLVGTVTAPDNGWGNWEAPTIHNVNVPAGNHTLRLEFVDGDTNFNFIDFVNKRSIAQAHAEAFGFGDKSGDVFEDLSEDMQQKFRFVTQIAFWSAFEPTDDNWDDDYIRGKIIPYTSSNIYVFLDLWPGSQSPDFLDTTYNVPYTMSNGKRWYDVNHASYKAEWQEMQKRLIDSVALLPESDRERVIAISVNMGKTNDFQVPFYENDLPGLAQYHYPVIDAHMNTKQTLLPNTRLSFSLPTWDKMLNDQDDWDLLTWATNNLTKPWASIGQPGKGYQLNEEKTMFPHMGTNYLWKKINGEYPANRNEVNTSGHDGACFENYKPWHVYWLSLYNIHWGTGLLNWSGGPSYFENGGDDYADAMDFLNRYAGEKDGLTAQGAWVALRDGLDALDTTRFPTSTYGTANNDSQIQTRAQNIVADFASDGATLGDPTLVTAGTIAGNFKYGNVTTGVLNDVGSNIFDGEYKLHMSLMNKSDLIGKWQVGPTDQPYGRFAMDVPNGEKIKLDLSDELFDGTSLEAETRVKFRVIYWDKASSQIKLKYDAMSNANKLLTTITKTNSSDWKVWESGWIDDAKFANRANGGSDLYIQNDDGADTIHMVEVRFENDRGGVAVKTLPAKVEAEEYHGFLDTTGGNSGDASCSGTDVDAETTSDTGGGCNVGWTAAGEWLDYNVTSNGGTFDLVLRLASNQTNKDVTVKLDGVTVGTVTAPSSGWQSFANRTISGVSIPAGSHTIRVQFDDGNTNFNYIDVVQAAAPVVDVTSVNADCNNGGSTRNTVFFDVTATHDTVELSDGSLTDYGGGSYRLRHIGAPFGQNKDYTITVKNGGSTVGTHVETVSTVASCP